MASKAEFGLNMGTPMVAGIITLSALGVLILLRKGFAGVTVSVGK